MGCHTWFYNEKENYTKKDFIKDVKIKINESLNFIKNSIKMIENEERDNFITDDLLRHHPEWTIVFFTESLKEVEGVIENFDNMTFDEILDISYDYLMELSYSEYTELFYVDNDEYHDLFRIGGYPEIKLHSFEDTLKFIKEHDIKINMPSLINLKEYWEKYPNGMIDFG